ncbi:MAG: twin-arginine translocase subunit TatB, partial [Candidatus Electrothrix sp. LOE2]|nr:twin-arginine translocase subunit TatB [Candidatus Electrothrix sp. LOE2]
MFGIGLPEMIVILAVALIVVGPDKLPELARSLAKGVNELKNTMNQVKESLSEETKVVSSVQRDIQQTAGQMKTHLLKDVTGNPDQWKQERDAVAAAS